MGTLRCNMNCPMCLRRTGNDNVKMKDLEPGEFRNILGRLQKFHLHFKNLTMAGGEPTLWPHLRAATYEAKESGLFDRIQIITNGMVEDASVYGCADVVRVTDYGAINRWYFHNLKKQLGKRFHISPNIHVPWPLERKENVSCSVHRAGILNGKIYRCTIQALNDIDGVDFWKADVEMYLSSGDCTKSEHCHTCMGNKNCYATVSPPVTLQTCVWGVEELSWMWRLPLPKKRLQKLYQWARGVRGR